MTGGYVAIARYLQRGGKYVVNILPWWKGLAMKLFTLQTAPLPPSIKRSTNLLGVAALLAMTGLSVSTARANPILIQVGSWAAEAAVGYGVQAGLNALTNGNNSGGRTYYTYQETNQWFSLDFHGGFNGDLSNVVISWDSLWKGQLTVNASDYWGPFSYQAVDSVTFSGNALHKPVIHDHTTNGTTVNYGWSSPSGNELIWDEDNLNEYFYPTAAKPNRYNVNGTEIFWTVPLGSVAHEDHFDNYAPGARFAIFTDARGNGNPEDDILSWSFHIEGRHSATPTPGTLSLLALSLFCIPRRR